jgi:hypothetical protein
LIDLIEDTQKLSKGEAVLWAKRWLGNELTITLTKPQRARTHIGETLPAPVRDDLPALLARYQHALSTDAGQEGARYLLSRGIAPQLALAHGVSFGRRGAIEADAHQSHPPKVFGVLRRQQTGSSLVPDHSVRPYRFGRRPPID